MYTPFLVTLFTDTAQPQYTVDDFMVLKVDWGVNIFANEKFLK